MGFSIRIDSTLSQLNMVILQLRMCTFDVQSLPSEGTNQNILWNVLGKLKITH